MKLINETAHISAGGIKMKRTSYEIKKDLENIMEAATIAESWKDICTLTGLSHSQVQTSLKGHPRYKKRITEAFEQNKKPKVEEVESIEAEAIITEEDFATEEVVSEAAEIVKVDEFEVEAAQQIDTTQVIEVTEVDLVTAFITNKVTKKATDMIRKKSVSKVNSDASKHYFYRIYAGWINNLSAKNSSIMIGTPGNYFYTGAYNVSNGDEIYFVSRRSDSAIFFTHMRVIDFFTGEVEIIKKIKFYSDSNHPPKIYGYPTIVQMFVLGEVARLKSSAVEV